MTSVRISACSLESLEDAKQWEQLQIFGLRGEKLDPDEEIITASDTLLKAVRQTK